jgi:acyl-[acyl-carrier-protein]-phospholipid O-acyltransferase/long-chain-fatty-acid--[acyl-carrier-protein] ligase
MLVDEPFIPRHVDAGERLFGQRLDLRKHLGYAALEGLFNAKKKAFLVDRSMERKQLSSRTLLSIALYVSKHLRKHVKEPRVGIVFTPGIGGAIANLAVVFADKVPVNLNFTAPRDSIQSAIARSGVKTVITAAAFREKFKDFPWPDDTLFLDKLLQGNKAALFWTHCLNKFSSVEALARSFGIPEEGDAQEAALLFTSGSAGEPKGVVLTHRNILANVAQIQSIGLIPRSEKMFACLPLFHSFGFTATLWYPLIQGVSLVAVPSPLEVKKNTTVIQEEGVTLFLGTPTFFRSYLKHSRPEDLKSLKYVVAGAEKTPAGLAEAWEERFSSGYLEGYGLTETTPVVSVNLPPMQLGNVWVQRAKRGSVGLLFPGMVARIVDPHSREVNPINKEGLLQLKGPNVFPGYLDDPRRTSEVFDGDWFNTGDLAWLDTEGFLYISGRLSRFSKIAGEMVPHAAIEEAIAEAFDLDLIEAMPFCVVAKPDTQKGERLVVLTTTDSLTPRAIQKRLHERGFPNLWIPHEVKRIDSMPLLASGKIDWQACKQLAQ